MLPPDVLTAPERSKSELFLVALAAFVAIQVLAGVVTEPVGAAESGFLSLLAGGVLAAIAVVAPRPAWEVGWTAILAVTAIWIVGYGPHRGAVVTLLLLAALAVAAARAGGAALLGSPGRSVALALGLQLMLRCDLLLPPLLDPRTLVSVLVLPAVAGGALHVLARRFGAPAAWIGGAAVVVLAPGWNVTVTLALASLAAGVTLADRSLAALPRVAALATLAVPPVWDPALGTLFVIGALTFLVKGRVSWLLTLAGIAVLAFVPPTRFGIELLELWIVGLVLVPALLVGSAGGRHLVLRGAFLGLVAAMIEGDPEVLAGALALAALGVRGTGGIGAAQSAWGGGWVLVTAPLAGYPWMREEPLAAARELLGLGEVWLALAAAVIVVAAGWALGAGERRWQARSPAVVVAVAMALALLRTAPASVLVPIDFEPVTLDSGRTLWLQRFPAREISGGVLDTHLIHGADLAPGSRVATVRLRGTEGELLGTWDLLAGLDTAEWAASRPDVAGKPGFRAPDPWLAQVIPGSDFFAQRFRARFHLDEPFAVSTIAIHRDPDLPPDTELVIYRVELRR